MGCSDPTSIFIEAQMATGEPAATSLTISVFDPHGARLHDRALDASKLPGTLILSGLSDTTQTVRVILSANSGAALGFASLLTVPHKQVSSVIMIGPPPQDFDGDGVPDPIDDCPTVADPLQENQRGNGPGDACFTSVDMGTTKDLAVPFDAKPEPFDGGGQSKCNGSGLLLCDGFESGGFGTLWAKDLVRSPQDGGPQPTVLVESGHAYRGSYAVHAHVEPLQKSTYVQAAIYENTVAPSGQSVFIRAFLFIEGITGVETNLMYAAQKVSPWGGVALSNDPTNTIAIDDWADPTGQWAMSPAVTPMGRWACFEWEIDNGPTPSTDAGTGMARVWIDEVEIPELNVQQLWTSPFFGSFGFGFDFTTSAAVGPLDIWIDEVAIDGNRIGCAR
jgi:hypothetical protein